MAQGNVIDARLLYQVGRGSTAPGHDPNKGLFARQLFGYIGREALGYFHDAWDKKKALAAKNENSDKDWAVTIAEEKGPLKEVYAQSLAAWTEERNKGQKIVANMHGFPGSKKYKKGMAMINNAQMKMENLYKSASERLKKKNEIKQFEATGTVTGADGKMIKAKYSSGTTGPEMHNAMSLADGSMDPSLVPNPETGYLEQVKEIRKGGFGPKGFVDETSIDIVPFNEIKWPGMEDTTHHQIGDKWKKAAQTFGGNGIELDEVHEKGVRVDIKQDVSEMSESAFRSWFFGGTQYKYTDSGKNFMTPAQDFIAQKYSELTNELEVCRFYDNIGCDQAKQEYEGILNTLKLQDLNSPEYQQFAEQSFFDVYKQFHNNSLEGFKEKNKKVVKKEKPQLTQTQIEDINKRNNINALVAKENISISDIEKITLEGGVYVKQEGNQIHFRKLKTYKDEDVETTLKTVNIKDKDGLRTALWNYSRLSETYRSGPEYDKFDYQAEEQTPPYLFQTIPSGEQQSR